VRRNGGYIVVVGCPEGRSVLPARCKTAACRRQASPLRVHRKKAHSALLFSWCPTVDRVASLRACPFIFFVFALPSTIFFFHFIFLPFFFIWFIFRFYCFTPLKKEKERIKHIFPVTRDNFQEN
jgi:hypothetical protein